MNPIDSVRTTLLVATTVTSSSSNVESTTTTVSDYTRITTTSGFSEATRVGTSGCSESLQQQQQPEVEGIASSSPNGSRRCCFFLWRTQAVHPAAMALRLRVTQVVCGILTCVLGATAFIEERGQMRLGSGVVAGAATVVASVASIYVTTFDSTVYYDRVRWITAAQYHGHGSIGTGSTDTDRTSCVLSTLWALAVVSNLAMLAFILMAFASSESTDNLIIIGSLELGLGTSVLVILGLNLCLALHYKQQLMRKN